MVNRKKASAKTAATALILNGLTAILGFISQKIFVNTLGSEYVGINNVFSSVISILTLADLGVSTAVVYHLYRALAADDHDQVSALMQFYHKACRIFGAIIIGGGLIMLPFTYIFIGETQVPENLFMIFTLFVLNSSLTYLFNYKRPLLNADQTGYINNWIRIGSTTFLYVSKIVVLLTTGNFYLFVLCTLVEKIIDNTLANRIITKRYPYINDSKKQLSKETKKDIKKKLYGSVFHNGATYVVKSTDNILISQFFGVISVGIYTNYHLIINTIYKFVSQIFNATTASLGNILAKDGPEHLFKTIKHLMLLVFWMSAVVCIAIYFCSEPFINVWLGDGDFILDKITVAALIINFYIQCFRLPASNILSAGGIIFENRFVPLIEAIINLGTSIILAIFIGLPGIFIGTILSNLFLHLYSYPKYAYKLVLKHKVIEYITIFAQYFALFFVGWIASGFVISFVPELGNIAAFIVYGLISVIVPSIIYWLIYHKTEDYLYFKSIIVKYLKKKFSYEKAKN